MITFNIPGKPQAKQRPRHGNGFTYTPKETVAYENWVRLCYGNRPKLTGEIVAEMTFTFSIAKSKTIKMKALMLSGEIRPTSRPDLDNLAKSVLDSLNGIAYDDDSQVVELHVKKIYGSGAGVEVSLMERKE